MTERSPAVLSGVLLDDSTALTLAELCQSCAVTSETVVEMVEYGILEPRGDSPPRWAFQASCLRRVTTARRLQRDLGVNLAGVALVLDLLDRIDRLESRLRVSGQLR
jgi:chaperone modulatory protein CbpM